MKKKDLNDLKTKSVQDLNKKFSEIEKNKVNELLELKMGKTKNVHAGRNIRKDIAKIKTIIAMKQNLNENQSQKLNKEKSALNEKAQKSHVTS